MTRGEIQQIGEILDTLVSRLGIKKQLKKAEVIKDWESIVGKKIADETKAELVKGKTLFVNASSPVWAQELEFLKPELLKKIRQKIGQGIITDIRFRTGKI